MNLLFLMHEVQATVPDESPFLDGGTIDRFSSAPNQLIPFQLLSMIHVWLSFNLHLFEIPFL
jgi:hypothetical protein